MPSLVFTLSITVDNEELPGFPLIRRAQTASAIPLESVPIPANNNTTTFVAVPGVASLTNDLQVLVLTPDQLVNLEFNANSFLPLTAGAVIAIFGTDITSAIAQAATINNPAAAVASNISGVVAGT